MEIRLENWHADLRVCTVHAYIQHPLEVCTHCFMTMCVIVINTIFLFSAVEEPWPGVAIFLNNALIFFRQVTVLVKPKLTLKGDQHQFSPNNNIHFKRNG